MSDTNIEYGTAMLKDEDLFPSDKLKRDEDTFHTSQFSRLYRKYAPERNARFITHPKYHMVFACLIPGVPSMLTHLLENERQRRTGSDAYRHLSDDDRTWFEEFFARQYGDLVPNVRDSSVWVRCPYSITRPIKRFFEDFDADKAIENMQNSKWWPQPAYSVYEASTGKFLRGMTADEIKSAWTRTGDDSSLRGSYAHLQFEKFFEDGQSTERCDTTIPEWTHFERFLREYVYARGWEPRIPEMLVVDDFMVGIFGFIDMVFYDPKRKGYVLVDYKRCKSIEKTSNEKRRKKFPRAPKTYGLPPLDDVEDCKFSHYSLQLNISRLILERGYGWNISEMCLVHVHPNAEAESIVFPVPRWNDAPQRIIYQLRSELLASLRPFCDRRQLPCARTEIDQTESALRHQWEATNLHNNNNNNNNQQKGDHDHSTVNQATRDTMRTDESEPLHENAPKKRKTHAPPQTDRSHTSEMETMFKEAAVHPAFPENHR